MRSPGANLPEINACMVLAVNGFVVVPAVVLRRTSGSVSM
ncbi:hypothetical protein HMPREF1549_00773 [Actinomyces johnsonii F0510]|uniref:Uncharacterized protein n=1 Tax=Actinomyces johnsonii F0510 TaxID=1227262 RepID=U1RNJ4_9ACTO|nr:hypothetical protein HMPREF1549_00773 [Actinomyces johnsonii F0510]